MLEQYYVDGILIQETHRHVQQTVYKPSTHLTFP
jgi:hypothetical protein